MPVWVKLLHVLQIYSFVTTGRLIMENQPQLSLYSYEIGRKSTRSQPLVKSIKKLFSLGFYAKIA